MPQKYADPVSLRYCQLKGRAANQFIEDIKPEGKRGLFLPAKALTCPHFTLF